MPPTHQNPNVRALAAMLMVLSSGCIQRTLINTVPEGATVSFEGTELGSTPDVVVPTRSGVPRDYILKVEKTGFEPSSQVLSATYRADESLLLLLLGIVPYFFSARLESSYPPVHLRPLDPTRPAPLPGTVPPSRP